MEESVNQEAKNLRHKPLQKAYAKANNKEPWDLEVEKCMAKPIMGPQAWGHHMLQNFAQSTMGATLTTINLTCPNLCLLSVCLERRHQLL
jgi:hypothetical protein